MGLSYSSFFPQQHYPKHGLYRKTKSLQGTNVTILMNAGYLLFGFDRLNLDRFSCYMLKDPYIFMFVCANVIQSFI